MLLLTSVPRLIYIDASANVKKGEIPFTSTLTCEPKNFKVFFVHTVPYTILLIFILLITLSLVYLIALIVKLFF